MEKNLRTYTMQNKNGWATGAIEDSIQVQWHPVALHVHASTL